eukprot:gene17002-20232_t
MIDPLDFQILDLSSEYLHGPELSKTLNAEYLEKSSNGSVNIVHGAIVGDNLRAIVSLPVRKFTGSDDVSLNVTFIIKTGSYDTTICKEALKALNHPDPDNVEEAIINGEKHPIVMSPEESYFADINLLGSGYLSDKVLKINYKQKLSSSLSPPLQ